MTTMVLLVRHGQTDDNVAKKLSGWSDAGLSALGREQALRLSSRLSSAAISAVCTSPLARTASTASILAEPHGLEPVVLRDLIEVRLGDWQGLYEDEIWSKWPDLRRQTMEDPSDVRLPKGESFTELAQRGVQGFEHVVSENAGGRVLVVTHDAVIRVIVAHVLGVSNSIYRRIQVDNASLSTVRAWEEKRLLVTLNDTSHLDG